MNRVLGRFTTTIGRGWHMHPIGVLFGLGFDTATEVALLFLAAGAAGAGLPSTRSCACPSCFVATWAVALGIWHFARIEERWST